MQHQSADPGEFAAPGAASSTALVTGPNGRGSESITRLGLPGHVVDLLRREGIVDLVAWRKLGNRRRQIFGITPRTIETLDQAAMEARR